MRPRGADERICPGRRRDTRLSPDKQWVIERFTQPPQGTADAGLTRTEPLRRTTDTQFVVERNGNR